MKYRIVTVNETKDFPYTLANIDKMNEYLASIKGEPVVIVRIYDEVRKRE